MIVNCYYLIVTFHFLELVHEVFHLTFGRWTHTVGIFFLIIFMIQNCREIILSKKYSNKNKIHHFPMKIYIVYACF